MSAFLHSLRLTTVVKTLQAVPGMVVLFGLAFSVRDFYHADHDAQTVLVVTEDPLDPLTFHRIHGYLRGGRPTLREPERAGAMIALTPCTLFLLVAGTEVSARLLELRTKPQQLLD